VLRTAPQRLRGITHVDDASSIVQEIQDRGTPGIAAKLFDEANQWSLPSFLQWYGLL
jgi:hypothetical protein